MDDTKNRNVSSFVWVRTLFLGGRAWNLKNCCSPSPFPRNDDERNVRTLNFLFYEVVSGLSFLWNYHL